MTVEMDSNADTIFGKDQVGGISIDVQDHFTCMVLDYGIGGCCIIVYQVVSLVDRVGYRFVLFCGYIIKGG